MGTISSGLLQAGVIKKSELLLFFCNSSPCPLTRRTRPQLSVGRSDLPADGLVLGRRWDFSPEISARSRPCTDANLHVPMPLSSPCLTQP